MADEFGAGNADLYAEEGAVQPITSGLNAEFIILVVVLGTVLLFVVGNYALFTYANKTLPPRKKKPVSKKKMKRERLKAGVAPAGD